jgi:hypothetical protein
MNADKFLLGSEIQSKRHDPLLSVATSSDDRINCKKLQLGTIMHGYSLLHYCKNVQLGTIIHVLKQVRPHGSGWMWINCT